MTFFRPRRFLIVTLLVAAASPATAFSQITGEDGTISPGREGIVAVPLPPVPGRPAPPPGEITPPTNLQGSPPAAPNGTPVSPGSTTPATGDEGSDPAADEEGEQRAPVGDLPPIEIAYGDDDLPQPVRDLRRKLMDAARSGNIEALRPYIETGANPTAVSVNPMDEDPVQTLKDASGDGEGVELLAILLETLQAGHVRLDPGGENEIYVWPYFTQVDLGALTKPQLVELFELVTAGDYQRMVGNGSYDFYRVGISPEGRLEFFVAGD